MKTIILLQLCLFSFYYVTGQTRQDSIMSGMGVDKGANLNSSLANKRITVTDTSLAGRVNALETKTDRVQTGVVKGGFLINKGIVHIGVGISSSIVGGLIYGAFAANGGLTSSLGKINPAPIIILAIAEIVGIGFNISGLVHVAHGGQQLMYAF